MSQRRIFVVSDTHLSHANVIEFAAAYRPFKSIEEHDEAVITYWNETVHPADTVWHLGDVFFGGQKNAPIIGKLQGRKHLAQGNHDQYPLALYQQFFVKIFSCVIIHNYILTHIPMHPCQLGRFKGNIHGHMHHNRLNESKYACVSLERTQLKPVLLDEVIAKLEAGELDPSF